MAEVVAVVLETVLSMHESHKTGQFARANSLNKGLWQSAAVISSAQCGGSGSPLQIPVVVVVVVVVVVEVSVVVVDVVVVSVVVVGIALQVQGHQTVTMIPIVLSL